MSGKYLTPASAITEINIGELAGLSWSIPTSRVGFKSWLMCFPMQGDLGELEQAAINTNSEAVPRGAHLRQDLHCRWVDNIVLNGILQRLWLPAVQGKVNVPRQMLAYLKTSLR